MANRGPDHPITKSTAAPSGTNHLLVIAIDQYQHCPRLYNCRRDAEQLIRLLTEKYQFEREYARTLFDEEATEEGILDAFKALIPTVGPRDNLMVAYFGHGEYEADLDEGHWIPVEARPSEPSSYISNSRIIKYIRAIQAHHIFFLVDACFSGTLFASRRLEPSSGNLERLERIASRWLLTAGRTEVVSDGRPGDHSPFTDNVLYFLAQNDKPSFPVSELVQAVTQAVTYNARQTPRGEPLQDVGHRGGQFFFRLKGAASPTLDPAPQIQNIPVEPLPPVASARNYGWIWLVGSFLLLAGAAFYFLGQQGGNEAQPVISAQATYDSLYQAGTEALREAEDTLVLFQAERWLTKAIGVAHQNNLHYDSASQALMEVQRQLIAARTQTEPPTETATPTPPAPRPTNKATADWQKALRSDQEVNYRRYLATYPDSPHREAAQEKIAGKYRYRLDFNTSITSGTNVLEVRIGQGKPPFRVSLEVEGKVIRETSEQKRISVDYSTIAPASGRVIGTVVVRDHNFKAKGSKVMVY